MIVVGIGIDVADPARFGRMWVRAGERFARKWFTDDEIASCARKSDIGCALAEHFAVKEAVWKALGPDSWSDGLIWREIAYDAASGDVLLTGRAEKRAAGRRLSVSAACVRHAAIATAILWSAEVSAR